MAADVLVSQLRQRVSGLVDNARHLTLDATASLNRSSNIDQDDEREVQSQLNSRIERERLSAMRQLILLMASGVDVSRHFSEVVKNVSSTDYEFRSLVYVYIIHYAHLEPDLILLSINAIQKLQNHRNPVIRRESVRALSSIPERSISGLVLLSIRKAARDPSALVRKSAAAALAKLSGLSPSEDEVVRNILATLLTDTVPSVLGSALVAYECLYIGKYDLLHSSYRRICSLLLEFDDWTQVVAVRVLCDYVRSCIRPPMLLDKKGLESESTAPSRQEIFVDPDLNLLLRNCKALFLSQNAAVIIAVAKTFRHLSTSADLREVVAPLRGLLRREASIQYMALRCISVIAYDHPTLFSTFIDDFFVWPADTSLVTIVKLDIIVSCVCEENADWVLGELHRLSASMDEATTELSIAAMVQCCQQLPSIRNDVIQRLYRNSAAKNVHLSEQSISALRILLDADDEGDVLIVSTLVANVIRGGNFSSVAQESIIWLVNRSISQLPELALALLQTLLKKFIEGETFLKYQILLLGAKLYDLFFITAPSENLRSLIESDKDLMKSMFSYLMQLAYYDMSYDIRDRARFLKSLLQPSSEKVNPVILHSFLNQFPTDLPIPRSSESRRIFTLGSTSTLTAEEGYGYVDMPNWATTVPPSSLRDTVQTIPSFNSTGDVSSPALYKTDNTHSQNTDTKLISLQKFYEPSETSEDDDEDKKYSTSGSESQVPDIKQSPNVIASQMKDAKDISDFEENGQLSETDSAEETDDSEGTSSSHERTVGLLASRFG